MELWLRQKGREPLREQSNSRPGAVLGPDQALPIMSGTTEVGSYGFADNTRACLPLPLGPPCLLPHILSPAFYTSPEPSVSLGVSITPHKKPTLEFKAAISSLPNEPSLTSLPAQGPKSFT